MCVSVCVYVHTQTFVWRGCILPVLLVDSLVYSSLHYYFYIFFSSSGHGGSFNIRGLGRMATYYSFSIPVNDCLFPPHATFLIKSLIGRLLEREANRISHKASSICIQPHPTGYKALVINWRSEWATSSSAQETSSDIY